ncbi:MAG: PAS domain S-box protein [Rhodothermales bacterium]
MKHADNEALFRTIFESNPECVILLSPDGVIMDINPAGEECARTSREELVGRTVHKLICPEYQDAYNRMIQGALGGKQGTLEFEVTDETGARFWKEATITSLVGNGGTHTPLIGITRDIHEKKKTQLENERLLRQNRWLARELMEAQEAERKQIAQELHDNLGQQLLAIRMDAEYIRSETMHDHATIISTTDHILRVTERVSREVRDLSERLHPLTLQYMGLSDSLHELVREWKTSQRNIDATYRDDTNDLGLFSEKHALTLYRVLQESLANASKHSGATKVNITLAYLTPSEWDELKEKEDMCMTSESPAHLGAAQLTIQDNGRGIQFAEIDPGRGLLGIRERIGALDGLLKITSTPVETGIDKESRQSSTTTTKSGTTISIVLPLDIAQ